MQRRDVLQGLATTSLGAGVGHIVVGKATAQDAPNPEIVAEITTPTDDTRSLTSAGETLWTGHGESSGEAIYEMEFDGSIVNSVSFSGPACSGAVQANGIAVSDEQLYVLGRGFEYAACSNWSFFILNRDTLEMENTYDISNHKTIATDGESVYLGTDNLIKEMTPATNQVRSIGIPESVDVMNGLAFDGRTFWIGSNSQIYQLDRDGQELSAFSYPRSGYVDDLAHDGDHLWLLQEGTNLLQLDTSVQTPTVTGTTSNGQDTVASQESDRNAEADHTRTSNGAGPGLGVVSTITALVSAGYFVSQSGTESD